MHCEVFEMHEEGLVLVALNEIQRRVGQFVRVVVAFFCRELLIVSTAKRIVIGTHPPRDLLVETISLRIHPQVCLTVVRGGVAMALECLG